MPIFDGTSYRQLEEKDVKLSAITDSLIADEEIDTRHIAPSAVTGDKIDSEQIESQHISPDFIKHGVSSFSLDTVDVQRVPVDFPTAFPNALDRVLLNPKEIPDESVELGWWEASAYSTTGFVAKFNITVSAGGVTSDFDWLALGH